MLTETFKILGVAFEPVAETWQSFVATERGKWITMNSSLMNYWNHVFQEIYANEIYLWLEISYSF